MKVRIKGPAVLRGRLRVPGDKSVGHRALMFGALAEGITEVSGLAGSADNHSTRQVLTQLGVRFEDTGPGALRVHGVGDALQAPAAPLDCGNSGTTMRLMLGILAGRAFDCELDGDDSLRRRPMARVTDPLARLGARFSSQEGRAPVRALASDEGLTGAHVVLNVASAQVKSALLLAGLRARGVTRVEEPAPSRDHSERMLSAFGATLRHGPGWAEVEASRLRAASAICVPGDISSAAFWLVAAAVCPGSALTLEGVGINPTRTGVLDLLDAAGVRVEARNSRDDGGEPVADLEVSSCTPHAANVHGDIVPRLVDELPVIAVLQSAAAAPSEVRDAAELRVKESDRVDATVALLRALGGEIEPREDGWRVTPSALRGGQVDARDDHRIAMTAAIAALRADGVTEIRGAECVEVSYPGFFDDLARLGIEVEREP